MIKPIFYPGIDASFTNGNSKFFRGIFLKMNRIPTLQLICIT